MIYFIKCFEFVKIGRADDPEKRVRELQTANPIRLELLGVIHGNDDEERRIHTSFAPYRTHGEWFYLSEALKAFIEAHTAKAAAQGKRPRSQKQEPRVMMCEVAPVEAFIFFARGNPGVQAGKEPRSSVARYIVE